MNEHLSFHLSEDFIEEYKNKEVPWGFQIGGGNSLSELTFILKYSRKKDDGTKERWWEVCQRCVEGMYSILKDHSKFNRTPWNDLKAQKSARDAYDRMFNFKWTPPGRGLQHMGTQYIAESRNGARLINCFEGSTELLTLEYGPVSFSETIGEEVTVYTTQGWEKGVIQSFGKQVVQRVTFKPWKKYSNLRHDITVTPNHKWILKDGSETTSLKVGDFVSGLSVQDIDSTSEDYFSGLLHGVVFGDGSKNPHVYVNGDMRFTIQACDDRVEQTLLLPEIKNKLNTLYQWNGNYIASVRNGKDLKELPEGQDCSPEYIKGFIEGWITADGTFDKRTENETYTLTSQFVGASGWLNRWAAFGGYMFVGSNLDPVMATNFGVRKNPMQRMTLTSEPCSWTVSSIEQLDEEIEVFCATVPTAGSFTLASGVYTGNCAGLTTEKISTHSAYEATMPFERLMDMSLNGIGVGIDTRGAGRITLHQPLEETEVYVIEDTREAWARSLGVLLESFFFKNRKTVEFDYSPIREEGAILKSFGGTASGPGPLIRMHEKIRELLSNREGESLTERDIVDIANLSGKAVVSGGSRRSALITFGKQDSEDYVNLKNWELPENAERTGADGWAWLSNNSILADVDEDLSGLIQSIAVNGEPGIIWPEMMQNYGRLADVPDYKDQKAVVSNPCVTGDTWTMTSAGPRQVCDLVDMPSFQW